VHDEKPSPDSIRKNSMEIEPFSDMWVYSLNCNVAIAGMDSSDGIRSYDCKFNFVLALVPSQMIKFTNSIVMVSSL
jgi:hypothetical protein